MKIIVAGDTHANWRGLNSLINSQQPDILIVCGDFGYWPREGKQYSLKVIKPQDTAIYFCDGNHEDHHMLAKFTEPTELKPQIWYMPRGSYKEFPILGNTLFMGGADSIDKGWRTEGRDWFPEEVITEKNIYNLPDVPIDTVISHTCSRYFDPEALASNMWKRGKIKDPSCDYLDYVYDKYKPFRWYFGHWHTSRKKQYEQCTHQALNIFNESNGYVTLED